ncbi:MAG: hypothetical protein QM756_20670 [Polyangiaceae bacterium]
MHDDNEIHDQGLAFDLQTITEQQARRRRVLTGLASLSLLTLFGCSDNDASADSSSGGTTGSGGSGTGTGGTSTASGGASASGGKTSSGGSSSNGTCSEIPEETNGPYPGDGSNGVNTLTSSGIVRSDIRSSFGSYSGTAEGIELTVTLTLVDAQCNPLAGYAIYIWHCDRSGEYSLYTVANQNYLRGVQETDENGNVTFTTIFPAAYSGRWPHIHFEIFESLAKATAGSNSLKISQLAMPKAQCDEVYATTGYEASVNNLAQTSLTTDMVFSDGSTLQLASVTGSVSAGYTALLDVAINA